MQPPGGSLRCNIHRNQYPYLFETMDKSSLLGIPFNKGIFQLVAELMNESPRHHPFRLIQMTVDISGLTFVVSGDSQHSLELSLVARDILVRTLQDAKFH